MHSDRYWNVLSLIRFGQFCCSLVIAAYGAAAPDLLAFLVGVAMLTVVAMLAKSDSDRYANEIIAEAASMLIARAERGICMYCDNPLITPAEKADGRCATHSIKEILRNGN